MYSSWIGLLLLAGILLASGAERICPIPTCRGCLDASLQTAPGLGFHLGLAAGTVSVSYGNGRVDDIVHIPGAPDYLGLMQQLTEDTHRLDPPPLDTIGDRLEFLRKKLRRRANLLAGRPGTPEAGVLGAMLQSLRHEAELRQPILKGKVGIALANAVLVSRDELNDALVYARLKRLDEHQVADRELNAAYGASGYGLCRNYTDPYECEQEEDAFGDGDVVLHIDYTRKALAANTHSITTAGSTYATTKFTDWTLGRDNARSWASDNEYWNRVVERLHGLATTDRQTYTKLLLTGNCAADKDFLRALETAFSAFQLATLKHLRKDRSFAYEVARGVAEFQWRRQRGWLGCVQPPGCPETGALGRIQEKVQHMLEL